MSGKDRSNYHLKRTRGKMLYGPSITVEAYPKFKPGRPRVFCERHGRIYNKCEECSGVKQPKQAA